MQDSPAYKTYLAFAIGAATPKKARKFKKLASPSKKETLLKKSIKRSKRETHIHQAGGSSEGADLESEVPDEPKGKSIDTSKGTSLIPGVPDMSKSDSSKSKYESWGDSDDDNDQQSDDERTKFYNDDKAADINKTDEKEDDEFVYTPEDYVPTNDEDFDDEVFDRINKEMYNDVNVELKDSEPEGDQEKDDAQATIMAALATQKTEVPQQCSSISSDYASKFINFDNFPSSETKIISMMDVKVQHEDPSIQTSPLLTILVSVIPESSIALGTTITCLLSSLFPNLQQSTPIPTTTTQGTTSTTVVPNSKTLSAIYQRLSDMENKVKTLRNIDYSSAIRATVKSKVLIVVKEYLGTSLDDAFHKALQRHTTKLVKEQSFIADVTDVLQQQPKPQKSAADINKIKIEQARKQQEPKYTIVSSDVDALRKFDRKRTLFETMTKTKSFERNSKHKALYHALIESILEDEDAMKKGVADKLKKRKPDDDIDEVPPAGPDQGLKRKKTCKETKPSKKAKSTGTSKGTTKPPTPDPEWNEGKSVENKPTQKWICDLYKAEKPSKEFDDLMSTPIDFIAFVMNRLTYTTSLTKTKAAKYDLKGIEDMVPKLWSPIKVAYDKHALLVTNVKVKEWYGYSHIEVRRSNQQLYKFMEGDFPRLHLNDIEDMLILVVKNRLFNLKGEDIVHLVAALRMFTRRIVIQRRVADPQLGAKCYQKKLNISKPRTREEDLPQRSPYTTLLNPQRVIYEDKLNRKRVMPSNELYKFSDSTL
ncbi:hypothetical protein Tco_1178964 [Tanacetum coccineum]